ncbi:MAG: hypothetical protein K9G46_05605 [Flavobacteriales bacterium]|nr:hypothetical protein [Flavobacteriales bacterium]
MIILEETYHLIQALSNSEKAYFKRLQHSSKKDSKLLVAYDVLNASKEYDSESIKEKFMQLGIAPSLHGQLLESVLRALRLHGSAHSLSRELNSLLDVVELLYDKKRYALCLHYVEKGISKSEQAVMSLYGLQFAHWKHKLNLLFHVSWPKNIGEQQERDRFSLEDINEKIELIHLMETRKNIFFETGELDVLRNKLNKQVLEDPIFKREKKVRTIENTFLYQNIIINSRLDYGDWEGALEEVNQLLAEVSGRVADKTALAYYVSAFFTVLRLNLFLRNSEGYTARRKELEGLTRTPEFVKNNEFLESILYPASVIIHLCYLATSGQTQYLENYYEHNRSRLEDAAKTNNWAQKERLLAMAWSGFVTNDFRYSLKHLAEMQSSQDTSMKDTMFYISKWLQILCHFELGDAQVFESQCRSLQRYMADHELYSGKHDRLLKRIRQAYTSADRQEVFHEIISDELISVHEFRMAFSYIDVFSWLKAKAEGKSLKAYFEIA